MVSLELRQMISYSLHGSWTQEKCEQQAYLFQQMMKSENNCLTLTACMLIQQILTSGSQSDLTKHRIKSS